MFALRDAKPVRVYHVSGELGRATNDFDSDGPLVEKTTYGRLILFKEYLGDGNYIFIDHEAREIMYLVASVRLSVCVLSHG